ncbi:MAG: hypothetical protein ACM337_08935 [Syntrophaceae bacterium]
MESDSKETFAPEVESFAGKVPLWLILVYAVLTVWGVYYLVAYWGGGPPTGG